MQAPAQGGRRHWAGWVTQAAAELPPTQQSNKAI